MSTAKSSETSESRPKIYTPANKAERGIQLEYVKSEIQKISPRNPLNFHLKHKLSSFSNPMPIQLIGKHTHMFMMGLKLRSLQRQQEASSACSTPSSLSDRAEEADKMDSSDDMQNSIGLLKSKQSVNLSSSEIGIAVNKQPSVSVVSKAAELTPWSFTSSSQIMQSPTVGTKMVQSVEDYFEPSIDKWYWTSEKENVARKGKPVQNWSEVAPPHPECQALKPCPVAMSRRDVDQLPQSSTRPTMTLSTEPRNCSQRIVPMRKISLPDAQMSNWKFNQENCRGKPTYQRGFSSSSSVPINYANQHPPHAYPRQQHPPHSHSIQQRPPRLSSFKQHPPLSQAHMEQCPLPRQSKWPSPRDLHFTDHRTSEVKHELQAPARYAEHCSDFIADKRVSERQSHPCSETRAAFGVQDSRICREPYSYTRKVSVPDERSAYEETGHKANDYNNYCEENRRTQNNYETLNLQYPAVPVDQFKRTSQPNVLQPYENSAINYPQDTHCVDNDPSRHFCSYCRARPSEYHSCTQHQDACYSDRHLERERGNPRKAENLYSDTVHSYCDYRCENGDTIQRQRSSNQYGERYSPQGNSRWHHFTNDHKHHLTYDREQFDDERYVHNPKYSGHNATFPSGREYSAYSQRSVQPGPVESRGESDYTTRHNPYSEYQELLPKRDHLYQDRKPNSDNIAYEKFHTCYSVAPIYSDQQRQGDVRSHNFVEHRRDYKSETACRYEEHFHHDDRRCFHLEDRYENGRCCNSRDPGRCCNLERVNRYPEDTYYDHGRKIHSPDTCRGYNSNHIHRSDHSNYYLDKGGVYVDDRSEAYVYEQPVVRKCDIFEGHSQDMWNR